MISLRAGPARKLQYFLKWESFAFLENSFSSLFPFTALLLLPSPPSPPSPSLPSSFPLCDFVILGSNFRLLFMVSTCQKILVSPLNKNYGLLIVKSSEFRIKIDFSRKLSSRIDSAFNIIFYIITLVICICLCGFVACEYSTHTQTRGSTGLPPGAAVVSSLHEGWNSGPLEEQYQL